MPAICTKAAGSERGQRPGGGDTATYGPESEQVPAVGFCQGAARGYRQHAKQDTTVLGAGQLGRLSRGHAKHQAGEGFKDEVLKAVSKHGNEHKQGEGPCLLFLPNCAKCFEEGDLWFIAFGGLVVT